MSGQRLALGIATVMTALLLQTTVITRLPLPGGAPDLLLVLVVAFALVEGPVPGMATGFAAGLLADLQSEHELGRLALVYVVIAYLVGLNAFDADRSFVLPFVAVGLASFGAVLLYAAEGTLLGDVRVTGGSVARALATTVPYDVVLTPFVLPLVAGLSRRLDGDLARR